MDLETIEKQILLLRERRQFLPEIRDYKPQRSGKAPAKVAEPVDNRPAEEIFAGLFKEEPDEQQTIEGNGGTEANSGRADSSEPGPVETGTGEDNCAERPEAGSGPRTDDSNLDA